jgi:hypothetical protein
MPRRKDPSPEKIRERLAVEFRQDVRRWRHAVGQLALHQRDCPLCRDLELVSAAPGCSTGQKLKREVGDAEEGYIIAGQDVLRVLGPDAAQESLRKVWRH